MDDPAAAADGRARSVFPGFDAVAEDASAVVGHLVERRRRLGLSQTVVAARMGTSQSAVARLEAGRSDARMSTLERYAAALDAAVSYGVSATQASAASTDLGDGR